MQFRLGTVLAAALMPLAPAFAQAPKNAVAPADVQREFDRFIVKFRTALKADDHAAVASMSRLPFMADKSIGNAFQFRTKVYRVDLHAKNRACIQRGKPVYSPDGQNNDNFFIFCGEHIFVFTKTQAGFLFTEIGMND